MMTCPGPQTFPPMENPRHACVPGCCEGRLWAAGWAGPVRGSAFLCLFLGHRRTSSLPPLPTEGEPSTGWGRSSHTSLITQVNLTLQKSTLPPEEEKEKPRF